MVLGGALSTHIQLSRKVKGGVTHLVGGLIFGTAAADLMPTFNAGKMACANVEALLARHGAVVSTAQERPPVPEVSKPLVPPAVAALKCGKQGSPSSATCAQRAGGGFHVFCARWEHRWPPRGVPTPVVVHPIEKIRC